MSLLEHFNRAKTEISQKVVQESRGAGENLRLKNAISANEQKIKQMYMEIGEAYYKEKQDNPEIFAKPMVETVFRLMAENEENRKKISVLKGNVICTKCGFGNQQGAKFCGECGARLPEKMPVLGGVICPKCGAQAEEGMRFCMSCGTELTEKMVENRITKTVQISEDLNQNGNRQETEKEFPDGEEKEVAAAGGEEEIVEREEATVEEKEWRGSVQELQRKTISEETIIKKCPFCGSVVEAGDIFCFDCGRQIEEKEK